MTRANGAVAEALGEFGELLSIVGGEPFKVRAYEKAARAVGEHPVDVADLDDKGIESIPSVGSHIAAKIRSLLETGHIDELDELRARVPAGLRSLLDVPGLGPKRARQVYVELGIASMSELLDALHDERLRELRGWGETSETNLRRAIAQAQQTGGRMLLDVALGIAEELVADLREVTGVHEAAYAGSLRRMCETIGDIDLLVAASDPRAVTDAFGRMDLVAEVPMRGPTKAVALTTKGVHVDLRVVSPEVWGAALLYFTGSKAHNIHLRTIAAHRGLKLSEYGLERVEDGTVLAATTEEQVYERLGMSWVPPTLREDRGEIEAAARGTLPPLVEIRQIRGDLHVHTDLTDGLATLEDMVAAAQAHRYRYLAITDHAPLLHMERMTDEKALDQRRRLQELGGRQGIALLHGSELNIQADGSLDWDDEFLAGFDILVASVHSAFSLSREDMTGRMIRAIEHPSVNIIGHPTARSIGHRAPIDFDVDAVFAAAGRAGTALEINSFPDRLDLPEDLVRLAHERGTVFAISTDAHSVRHLDNMRYGVAVAQRGWLDPAQVINTWPLGKLQRFLSKGRSPNHRPKRRAVLS